MKLPFWATAFTLIGMIILISLGTWQLERLKWKEDLISKITNAYAQKSQLPIDLEAIAASPEFTYGTLTGILKPDKAFLLGPPRIKNDIQGLDLIVPIEVKTRKTTHTVLVNMGWTSATLKDQPIYTLQDTKITFNGLLRFFSWNAFTPPNNPQDDLWYRLDIPLISASKSLKNLYPAVLVADHSNHKFDAAFFGDGRIAEIRKLPNNNHMQYALFWFAMAFALSTVYILRFIKNPLKREN